MRPLTTSPKRHLHGTTHEFSGRTGPPDIFVGWQLLSDPQTNFKNKFRYPLKTFLGWPCLREGEVWYIPERDSLPTGDGDEGAPGAGALAGHGGGHGALLLRRQRGAELRDARQHLRRAQHHAGRGQGRRRLWVENAGNGENTVDDVCVGEILKKEIMEELRVRK